MFPRLINTNFLCGFSIISYHITLLRLSQYPGSLIIISSTQNVLPSVAVSGTAFPLLITLIPIFSPFGSTSALVFSHFPHQSPLPLITRFVIGSWNDVKDLRFNWFYLSAKCWPPPPPAEELETISAPQSAKKWKWFWEAMCASCIDLHDNCEGEGVGKGLRKCTRD